MVNIFLDKKGRNSFYLDLHDIDSLTFLTPFLDIIRSDETSGPLTCLALDAINKFLSYGLIGRINPLKSSSYSFYLNKTRYFK